MQKRLVIYGIILGTLFSGCGPGAKQLSKKPKGPVLEHELLGNSSPSHSTDEDTKTTNKPEAALSLAMAKAQQLEAFENFTQDWEGVPHRMGGATKRGVDCSGFVIVAYREVLNHQFLGRRAEDLFNELRAVEREDLQYGDLVFFKIHGRRISHVGIYLGGNEFAHASSSMGVRVSSLELPYWEKRFFKGGRYSAT